MKFIKPRILLVLAVICMPIRIVAEDIDLFVGPSTATPDSPNVLIILDNTANWGPEDKFQAQKEALVSAFEQLPDDQINIGLMMYTESGGGNKGPDGGYVRAAVRNMNEYTKAAYRKLLVGTDADNPTGLDRLLDASNSGKSGKTMAEAYLYFNSNYQGSVQSYERPYSGNNKEKVDWGVNLGPGTPNVTKNAFRNRNNNPTCCEDSYDVWALPDPNAPNVGPNALDSVSATEYNSPVDPNECADNYIIFIGNGPAQDSAQDSREARELLSQQRGTPDTETIDDLDPPNSVDNMADEWSRYMQQSPLNISTFALDVQIGSDSTLNTNSRLGWSALMRSMSEGVGGGEYYDIKGEAFDPNDFALALDDAFSRILARNSVFASVALPAAANEQSTFLNQVYVGLFRPDAGADPRWTGNLKQYQLGIDPEDKELKALDANEVELIDRTDAGQGFIQGCARSFWTPVSENDNYWDYLGDKAVANCDEASRYKNTPDGPIVEKGGQAYTLRAMAPSARKVYTCSATLATCSSTSTLVDFTNLVGNGVTGAMLDPNNPVGATERTELLKWAIGYDIDNEIKATTPDPDAMRPSVHGDIVHSQPVAIDYNADPTAPEVVVYYGGNDGMLRAINGNQTTDHGTGTPAAGYEFWSFLPPEFYGSIKRLRDNTPRVIFPASGPTAGQGVVGMAKSYGMDGPLTAHQADLNGDDVIDEINDERLLFAGLRRAGRVIYAFDITDRDSPEMKWKVGCPNLINDTGCTPATDDVWEDVGQTWSRVSVTYAAGYIDTVSSEMKPLLFVGGGYDNCEDEDTGTGVTPVQNNSCSSGTKGNRVYVLDARTGAVVTSFPTDRAVPGNVTVVPISDDVQQITFAYVADMGGNVYRISGAQDGSGNFTAIGSSLPGTWQMTKIASLGCPTTATCDVNRKFLFGPDVIRIPSSNLFGILLGSGDREKPLQDYSATLNLQNYFFSMVDDPTNGSWLTSENTTAGGPCGDDVICMDSLGEITLPGMLPEDSIEGGTPTAKGWRLEMRAGEQIVTGAITIDNEVNFSTHIPAVPGECGSDYGTATAFSLNYLDASGEATQFLGGGLVPTPVAGKVLIDGVPVPFCIGCGGEDSAIGVKKVGGGITWTQPRSRVYWNIDRVD